MRDFITNDVKLIISLGTIIVVLSLAWADIRNTAYGAKEEVIKISEKQDKMAQDITEIKTVLKQEGLTSDIYTTNLSDDSGRLK